MKPVKDDQLLPVAVVAKRLKVHRSYVYRLISGEMGETCLEAVRVGAKRAFRISSSSLEKYLKTKSI